MLKHFTSHSASSTASDCFVAAEHPPAAVDDMSNAADDAPIGADKTSTTPDDVTVGADETCIPAGVPTGADKMPTKADDDDPVAADDVSIGADDFSPVAAAVASVIPGITAGRVPLECSLLCDLSESSLTKAAGHRLQQYTVRHGVTWALPADLVFPDELPECLFRMWLRRFPVNKKQLLF